MANVLLLVHRIPYPPDKGDKLRSYHLLLALAAQHRVFLGTLVDEAQDMAHVAHLRSLCADVHAARLHPRFARAKSLLALGTGEPLTLRYFHDAGLADWVRRTVTRERIDAVVVFSSSMAPYAEGLGLPVLVDFVDVDSAKWAEYAHRHRWPMSWIYAREGRRLLDYERRVATHASRAFFTTAREVELFLSLAPECRGRVQVMSNGVDADRYAPDPARLNPYPAGSQPLVFTGAMDYWPNVDAVVWFVHEVLPRLKARFPQVRLHVVGRNPTQAVAALAGPDVEVTGAVPDVRPYIQHAAVAVAPLRLARGVQNKVLEAMSMARPVVAASVCVQALDADEGVDLLAAESAVDYEHAIAGLLMDPARGVAIGHAARQCVLARYGWAVHLRALEQHLPRPGRPLPPAILTAEAAT